MHWWNSNRRIEENEMEIDDDILIAYFTKPIIELTIQGNSWRRSKQTVFDFAISKLLFNKAIKINEISHAGKFNWLKQSQVKSSNIIISLNSTTPSWNRWVDCLFIFEELQVQNISWFYAYANPKEQKCVHKASSCC